MFKKMKKLLLVLSAFALFSVFVISCTQDEVYTNEQIEIQSKNDLTTPPPDDQGGEGTYSYELWCSGRDSEGNMHRIYKATVGYDAKCYINGSRTMHKYLGLTKDAEAHCNTLE